MQTDTLIKTTVRLPVDLHKALTDEIQRRKYTPDRISMDKAVQEAVALWLERSAAGERRARKK